jgi:hypothetical protein
MYAATSAEFESEVAGNPVRIRVPEPAMAMTVKERIHR